MCNRWIYSGRWVEEKLEDGRERFMPEVVVKVSIPGRTALEFRLADEAEVEIIDDPYDPHKGIIGSWGSFRLNRDIPFTQTDQSFVVAVRKGVWQCDLRAITLGIAALQDTISRRNRLIRDLRKENRKLRERLAALSEKNEPARS